MTDMKVHIAGVELQNPVIAASGTFGFGREYGQLYDLSEIGAISVKGLTKAPRAGNPPPRITETPGGILNSVGLQNPGVDAFIRDEIPYLRQYRCKIIANMAGNTFEDYCEMAEKLSAADVDFLEMNISCPNVKAGGAAFGTHPDTVFAITDAVRKYAKKPLIVKLSPNVADITETAKAAEAAGADALSLINTLTGMAIDIRTRRPILANVIGGMSGPCVKPVALRMVYQVYRAVQVPIIGMGGITSGEDAVEFLLAGSTAISVGTANFTDPYACIKIRDGIRQYMQDQTITKIGDLTGGLLLE
ncbi:MAG: dihydroorotate dehydrogenase [Ruminococcaceae bacterium]|nr:dihydroorotate dehydrogenase [Oscillospiraceae bacterium]